jgi:hypothetical protein
MTGIRIALIATIVLITGADVQAKWKPQYAQSPNATWFEEQQDCKGKSCCGQADGDPYYDGYDQNADGSVTLGNGTKIESCQVLKGPNPKGHAIWWHSGDRTYCFSPGPGF